MSEEKKGVTVKIDAELHEEVRRYLNDHGMTMAEFVSAAMRDELHPKIFDKEADVKTRTLAFQVPEELFGRIKDYLTRHNMTQKEFVIGLIESELDRDMAMRENNADGLSDVDEQSDTEAMTDDVADVGERDATFEGFDEDTEEDRYRNEDDSDQSEHENEEDEEDEDESEGFGMTM